MTNAQIGKKIAHTLPAISFAAVAISTAMHTRILQRIPEQTALNGVMVALP
jgi:hypothetical protein